MIARAANPAQDCPQFSKSFQVACGSVSFDDDTPWYFEQFANLGHTYHLRDRVNAEQNFLVSIVAMHSSDAMFVKYIYYSLAL
jgi:hypothetical protein